MKQAKKWIALFLSAVMAATMGMSLTACSNGVSSKGGGKKLTVWTYMQAETDTIKKYAGEWAKKTGNSVNVIYQTASMQQFSQAANSSQGPDLIYGIANDLVGTFATANLVAPVPAGTIQNTDYTDASIQATLVNGKQYSVPLAIEGLGLFYNKEKLSTPPATWDDLLADAQKVGFMYNLTEGYYIFPFVQALGGYIFKYNNGKYDTKDIGLGSEGAVRAYSMLGDLVTKYHFMSADITLDVAKSNFQNGKTGLYIGGPWDIAGFKSAGVNFAVTTLPTIEGKQIPTFVGTQVAFVSAKSKNQSAAWEFIKYMSDNATLALYQVGSRIPAKKSFQNSAELKDSADVQAIIKQASYGVPLVNVPEMNATWTPVQNNFKLLIAGKSTAEKAAADIVANVKTGIATLNTGSNG